MRWPCRRRRGTPRRSVCLNWPSTAIRITGPRSPGPHSVVIGCCSTAGAKIRRPTVSRTDYARRAVEVAGDDPAILANAAYTLGYLGEDIGAMITLVDRALALNPSFAR